MLCTTKLHSVTTRKCQVLDFTSELHSITTRKCQEALGFNSVNSKCMKTMQLVKYRQESLKSAK